MGNESERGKKERLKEIEEGKGERY